MAEAAVINNHLQLQYFVYELEELPEQYSSFKKANYKPIENDANRVEIDKQPTLSSTWQLQNYGWKSLS